MTHNPANEEKLSKYDRIANAVEMLVISLFFFLIGSMLLFGAANVTTDLLAGDSNYLPSASRVFALYLGAVGFCLKAYVWFPVPAHQQRRMHKKSLAAQNLEELDRLDIANTIGSLLIIILFGEIFLLSPYGRWDSKLFQAAILLWIGVPRIQRLHRAIQAQRQQTSKTQ